MSDFASKTQFLVVGAGIAGVSAAEAIHKTQPDASITMVSDEHNLPYFRMNLTRYLAGELERDRLDLHNREWYHENHVEIILDTHIDDIDAASKQIRLENGRLIEYDKLILANGASPFVPPIPGRELDGVMTLRSLEDADKILNITAEPANVVCIGGGLLGLEIAGGIAQKGTNVTVLEALDWLLPRQLGKEAAEMLRGQIEAMGIKVIVPARIKQISGEGKVSAVELDDGTIIPANLVLISAGIRPNLDLAKRIGLEVNRGVIVNEHMQTSDPDIYAAGDVCEYHGILYGLWVPARKQGEVAGRSAAGQPTEYPGDPPSAKLKVLGLDLFSIGQFSPAEASDRLVTWQEGDRFISFLFRDAKMIGSNLLGETGLDMKVKKAIDSGKDFSESMQGEMNLQDLIALL
ncbi:MAG: NAD(P)/FAD-dependent oxidoreductase [Chloroflexi bacterium]|jgi:nitrite reductase (NADH) large subunit|nr:NAD(P)/FAD-dependent oxidoreductase [Chloroflexota bacterium]